jgi:hypothetical protein
MGFETNRAALNACSGILVARRQLMEGRDFGLKRSDGKAQARHSLRAEKLGLVFIYFVAQLAWAESALLVAAIHRQIPTEVSAPFNRHG